MIELKSPKTIKNWTVKNGYFGHDFTVQVKNNKILCTSIMGGQQRIPKKDFELVYENWEDYLSERNQRQEFTYLSRFTKGTISIIHQFVK